MRENGTCTPAKRSRHGSKAHQFYWCLTFSFWPRVTQRRAHNLLCSPLLETDPRPTLDYSQGNPPKPCEQRARPSSSNSADPLVRTDCYGIAVARRLAASHSPLFKPCSPPQSIMDTSLKNWSKWFLASSLWFFHVCAGTKKVLGRCHV